MKKLAQLLSLAAIALGFSSCCSMSGITGGGAVSGCGAGYRTETKTVKVCGYDVVTEEIVTPATSKGGMATVTTVEKKVPRYKTVTKRVRVKCPPCVQHYCAKKDCCGTTSEATMRMATAQGGVGSPHIGLIPTMKPLPLSAPVSVGNH